MSQSTLNRAEANALEAEGFEHDTLSYSRDYRSHSERVDADVTEPLKLRTQKTTTKRKKVSLVALGLAQAALFSFTFAVAISGTMLSGCVMTKFAQQQGDQAKARATAARSEQKLLEARIEEATRLSNIEAWAVAQGMIAPDKLADEGVMKDGKGNGRKLVASVR
jgi:hypothetical protein